MALVTPNGLHECATEICDRLLAAPKRPVPALGQVFEEREAAPPYRLEVLPKGTQWRPGTGGLHDAGSVGPVAGPARPSASAERERRAFWLRHLAGPRAGRGGQAGGPNGGGMPCEGVASQHARQAPGEELGRRRAEKRSSGVDPRGQTGVALLLLN